MHAQISAQKFGENGELLRRKRMEEMSTFVLVKFADRTGEVVPRHWIVGRKKLMK